MNKKRKVLLFTGVGVLVIAVVVAVFVLFNTNNITINRVNDQPMIVYEKHDGMNLYQLGSSPQKITPEIYGFKVSPDGKLIAYSFARGDALHQEVYLLNDLGVNRQLARNVCAYEVLDDYKVVYVLNGGNDLIIREYTPQGDIKKEETVKLRGMFDWWGISDDANTVVTVKNMRSELEGSDLFDFNWADLYMNIDGETELIAKKAFLSSVDNSISDNGKVLYLADCDAGTETGSLYVKEMHKDPVAITTESTRRFAISSDGELIAAVTENSESENYLLYQYGDSEPYLVEDVFQFLISENQNALIYSVQTDVEWAQELYFVEENSAPVMLADHIAILFEVSADGKSAVYMKNFNPDEYTGDLYLVRVGTEPELIDTDVSISYLRMFKYGICAAKINDDGSVVAYLKGYNDKIQYADLYVKQAGQEPQKVDEGVNAAFDFFQ